MFSTFQVQEGILNNDTSEFTKIISLFDCILESQNALSSLIITVKEKQDLLKKVLERLKNLVNVKKY